MNSRIKKICVLTSVHSSTDVRIFHKECKTLAYAGYQVTLIAQHNNSETIDGVKIIPLKKPKNRFSRILLLPWKIFFIAVRQKADVYHFHDPELIIVGVLLRLMSSKVVYDVHEDYAKSIAFKTYLPYVLRILIAKTFLRLERLLSKFFDAIVTATDGIKETFPDQNAVAVRNYPIIGRPYEIGNKKNMDHVNFIYIGGIDKSNGMTEIICAMEKLKLSSNSKLVLAGKFFSLEYEMELRGLKGFEKVEYKGWVSFSDVPELLVSSDAGLVCCLPEPNSINSLPNKMFEYMSAGLPVIASNFPLWIKIVEKCFCGLCVNAEEPGEIAKAMEFMINNPEIKRQMGENGRRAVEDIYNWEKEAKVLINLYRRLID